jgi:hypothetical protein
MALTDTEIKKSRAAEKAYRISDGSGLYVWVTPAGGKLWRWGYDFDGKEKLMSFGKYPAVARARARPPQPQAPAPKASGDGSRSDGSTEDR